MTPFKQRHYQDDPLLIANVWDVASAKIAQRLGFEAIGTSSSAIAQVFGYADGEDTPFDLLLTIVKAIHQSCKLPLSVDIEAGYGSDIATIIANIRALMAYGIVGINIEDSVVDKTRQLVPIDTFTPIIRQIKATFGDDLFINVRTDTHLLGIKEADTAVMARLVAYENAGADGIFIPCLTEPAMLKKVCSATTLPINVMALPQLADFDTLADLGVKRISMGNMVFEALQNHHQYLLKEIQNQHNFDSLFL